MGQDFAVHEQVTSRMAVPPTRITTNTTVTGSTFDVGGVREHLALIDVGAYTVGSPAVALNLQLFAGRESDMGDEAQVGSNLAFTAQAANTQALVRIRSESHKTFFRLKVVSSGGTNHDVVVGVNLLHVKDMPAATLLGTIEAA